MKKLIVLILLFSAVWKVNAQEISSLSIEKAVETALSKKATFLNSQIDIEVAKQNRRATKGQYLPQVSAAAEMKNNVIRPTSILPGELSNRPGQKIPVQFGTLWQNSAGVTVSQKLYDGNNLSQQMADAVQEKIALNNQAKTKIALAYDTYKAYYQALWYEAKLKNLATDFKRKTETATLISNKAGEGRALPTEVTEAQIASKNSKVALDNANRNLVLAKQYLLFIIGSDTTGGGKLKLTTTLAEASISKKTLVSGAVQPTERPEITEQSLNEELAIVSAKSEAKKKGPVVALNGYLGTQGFNNNFAKSLDFSSTWYGNSYIALNVSMPLFNGFDTETKVQKQRLKGLQSANTKKELLQNIAYEQNLAKSACLQALDNWQVKKENVALAISTSALVKARAEEGRNTNREVLDATATLSEAESQEIEASYNLLLTVLDYEKALGTLVK